MTNSNTQLQLSIISGPYTAQEKQFILRNLNLNNQELAGHLGRSEPSIRKFLNTNQIRRTDDQLQQIRQRIGANQLRDKNPNWKGGRSSNHYYYKLRTIANHPERQRARVIVSSAIRSGKLIPQPCEVCNCMKSEAHHESYLPGEELKINWLCRFHHRLADQERRTREASEQNFYHDNRCTDNSQKGL